MNLEELMNPKAMDKQARYENYRIAVDKAWKYAFDLTPKEDSMEHPYFASFIFNSRRFKDVFLADLNEAIKILNEKEAKSDETGHSSFSGHS